MLMKGFALLQRAQVFIERPYRYGKQLASHFSHKTIVTEIEAGWQVEIRNGIGKIIPHDETSTLTLVALANDPDTLAMVEEVLEGHLLKFAAKLDPLEVNWVS